MTPEQEAALKALHDLRATYSPTVVKMIDQAVAEERARWLKATGFTGGACCCAGCKHQTNCACICPECRVGAVVAQEREACAKLAESRFMQGQLKLVAFEIAAAIRARSEQ